MNVTLSIGARAGRDRAAAGEGQRKAKAAQKKRWLETDVWPWSVVRPGSVVADAWVGKGCQRGGRSCRHTRTRAWTLSLSLTHTHYEFLQGV